MSLFHQFKDSNGSIDFLFYNLKEKTFNQKDFDFLLDETEIGRLDTLTVHRKNQFLAVKHCLLTLEIESAIHYTERGKPFLPNSKKQISISHTKDIVAVAISNLPIGIDLEHKRFSQLIKVESKFINDKEKQWVSNKKGKVEYLQIIWGTKESLYKLSEGKYASLKNDFKIDDFELSENTPITSIIKDELKCISYLKKIEDLFLVWSIKS